MKAHVFVEEDEYPIEEATDSLLFVQSKFAALPINHAENVTLPVLVSVFAHNSSVVDDNFQNDVGVVIAIIEWYKK